VPGANGAKPEPNPKAIMRVGLSRNHAQLGFEDLLKNSLIYIDLFKVIE
jgi:hypothetical protein